MATKHPLLSATRINLMKAQGYCNYSDDELSELAFGNKFAYMVYKSHEGSRLLQLLR
jgi:hypothetical protein